MKAFKDDNEARLYGRFYARLSKYPDINLFCVLTEQARELNALRDENKRLIETFFVNRSAR